MPFCLDWLAVSVLRYRLARPKARLDVGLNFESLSDDLVLVLLFHGFAFQRLFVISFQSVVGLQ
jgi:hypothetical protein